MDQLAVFISLPLWQLFIFFGWVVLVRINLASVFSPLFLFSIFLWQDCLSSPLPYQTSLTSLCKREVCVAPTCNCMSCLYFYFFILNLFYCSHFVIITCTACVLLLLLSLRCRICEIDACIWHSSSSLVKWSIPYDPISSQTKSIVCINLMLL